MPKTTTRIGPAEHGRRMSLDESEPSEIREADSHELGGVFGVVADVPEPGHLRILDAIRRRFATHDPARPGMIDTVAGGGECEILLEVQRSECKPDLVTCRLPAPDKGNAVWRVWVPEFVVAVVSPNTQDHDYREKREEEPATRSLTLPTRTRVRRSEQPFGPSDSPESTALPGVRFDRGPAFADAG